MGIGKYEIVDCEPKHALLFTDDIASTEINLTEGLAFTALYHGDPIACAGIRFLWPGVAEAWLLIGPKIREHTIFVYKSTKRYLNDLMDKHKIWRMQAYCRADYPEAINFLYHLGFEVEGKAKRYSPDGTDAYSMSIVREE